MDRSFSNQLDVPEDHAAIREGVRAVVTRFDDEYWLARDEDGEFPREFHRAMADAGWLGITMPEELGGAGLGVTEAAIMMHAVTQGGGAFSAASTIHLNLFGPHAIVVHGTPEQKARWLKPLIEGREKACFGAARALDAIPFGPSDGAQQDRIGAQTEVDRRLRERYAGLVDRAAAHRGRDDLDP